jgi:hypothetical protein
VLQHANGDRDFRRPNPRDEQAFRRLAEASLAGAIDDAAGEGSQAAYSAIRWLAGHTADGLTFERCCELIGLAPHAVRNSLRRHYKPIRLRFEKYQEVYLMAIAQSHRRAGTATSPPLERARSNSSTP